MPADPAVVAAADDADRIWRHQSRTEGRSELAGPPALVHRGAVAQGALGLYAAVSAWPGMFPLPSSKGPVGVVSCFWGSFLHDLSTRS